MLTQFIETIHEEMDYTQESSNLKKIKKNIAHHKNVIVPSVYDDYSTKSVLTMEYVPGIKITNIEALDAKGIDRKKLVYWSQIGNVPRPLEAVAVPNVGRALALSGPYEPNILGRQPHRLQ